MPDGYNNNPRPIKPTHCCCRLVFKPVTTNKPPAIDLSFWVQATAEGELCGHGNTGSIEISAAGLIPAGVYSLWFLTDRGPFPAAPLNAVYTADSLDPNRLVVNSDGILNYYIAALDFNPFKGIPASSGGARIQQVAIAYHTNRLTNGRTPGELNVNVFYQLIAPVSYPRDK